MDETRVESRIEKPAGGAGKQNEERGDDNSHDVGSSPIITQKSFERSGLDQLRSKVRWTKAVFGNGNARRRVPGRRMKSRIAVIKSRSIQLDRGSRFSAPWRSNWKSRAGSSV